MDLRLPIRSVIPGVQGLVLGVLANTTTPLTGRAVAGLLDGDAAVSGVSRVLGQLVEAGLVTCEPAGRANLYALNRRHVAAAAIEGLAGQRDELLRRIRSFLAGWDPPLVAAWLFGSMARGDGSAASDIDILLVRPDTIDDDRWVAQTMALAAEVRAWSGNACEIVDVTEVELGRLVGAGDPLIAALRRDALELAGESPRRLLRAGPTS
jgi:predicted nucleotidyltransferase